MANLRNNLARVVARLLSLWKRSFASHASVQVSDLQSAKQFYKALGFVPVTTSRSGEVTLLRNHNGDELNLVQVSVPPVTRSIAFQTKRLTQRLEELQPLQPELVREALGVRATLRDPDGNRVELFEVLQSAGTQSKGIYHVATLDELRAGLTADFYLAPVAERRFVCCLARSAFLELVCGRVAEETEDCPLVVELSADDLSLEVALASEDLDVRERPQSSTYPHVNQPVKRSAILGVGRSVYVDGSYRWPETFATLDAALSGSA